MGVGYTHLTTKDGQRHSTAAAFLRPALGRNNLSVITRAQVHKVEIEGLRAVGVTYMQDGALHTVKANREVILSAGALESPRLLMLSGIGERAQLEEFGIPVLKDLPGVGKNLHPPPTNMAIQPLHAHAFMKTDAALPGPDLQPLFFHVPTYLPEQEAVTPNAYTLNAGGIRPTSRGELRLTSADPQAPLMLDPNLLATDYDVAALVHNMRINREIVKQPALAEWTAREIYPGPDKQTDEELADYARSAVTTYHHQVGTCKMGRDAMAVVDSGLKVHGVAGLRVVDASIMPQVTSGNTNAPTIMIAEKAADIMMSGALAAGSRTNL
jgi:choline dehydrogenase